MTARPSQRRMRIVRALGVLAGLAVAACSSPPSAATRPATTSPTTTSTAKASTAKASPAARGPPRVTVTQFRTADGSVVTVAVFRGPVQYALHNGSQDPGPAYAALVRAGPSVAGAERRRLLAAFNGGFLLRSRAGGYEQEGHVFRSLRHGLASLVIDRSGQARIGVWGVDVPAPGEAVYSVRQNLWPLVENGQPTAEAARWWRWGGTIGHAEYVARSALGQDASGDLIYAASMSTVPEDLAVALARSSLWLYWNVDATPAWNSSQIAPAASASNLSPAIARFSDGTVVAATRRDGSLWFYWNVDARAHWNSSEVIPPGPVTGSPAMTRSSGSTEIAFVTG